MFLSLFLAWPPSSRPFHLSVWSCHGLFDCYLPFHFFNMRSLKSPSYPLITNTSLLAHLSQPKSSIHHPLSQANNLGMILNWTFSICFHSIRKGFKGSLLGTHLEPVCLCQETPDTENRIGTSFYIKSTHCFSLQQPKLSLENISQITHCSYVFLLWVEINACFRLCP